MEAASFYEACGIKDIAYSLTRRKYGGGARPKNNNKKR